MNKKFSTLLCASLLASAFTVNADVSTDYGKNIDLAAGVTTLQGANATAQPGFSVTNPVGVYQLRDQSNKVLAVVENSRGENVYKMVDPENLPEGVKLKNTLWCVQITAQANLGQDAIFDFVNKGTSEILAFDSEDSELAGVAYGGWAFSPTWFKNEKGEGEGLKPNYSLYTHKATDKVLVMYAENDLVKGGLVSTEEASKTRLTGNLSSGKTPLRLTIYNAGTYVLNAAEINAYLKDNKNKLTFAPDSKGEVNQFTANELVALGISDNKADNEYRNFVYVTKKEDEKQYLKVDTASNSVGTSFLKLAWTNTAAEGSKDALVRTDAKSIADQHKFLFIYQPSGDELFIQVEEARYKNEKTPEDYWYQASNIKEYGDKFLGLDLDKSGKNDPENAAFELFVKLQDFTIASSVVTIGERPINTKISFGVDGCFATSDKTSVANGLYVIKNEKGQVLAAPIHLNAGLGYEAEWVTLDEQDPKDMPAYQWVITKTLSADKAQATSPLSVTNREFPNLKGTIQLRLVDGKIVAPAFQGKDMTNITFDQITDKAILSNKKLGYRFIPSDSLRVNKYVFNYLNPFTDSYWMANGLDKDSVNYVKEEASRYVLKEGSTSAYGIEVTEALLKKIPGLAQLERTNYVIKTADGSKSLVEAYNDKYAMGVSNLDEITPYVVDSFFFKENNHYNSKHFYAIVEASSKWVNKADPTDVVYANEAYNAKGEFVGYYEHGGNVFTPGSDYAYAGAVIQNLFNSTHKVGTADDGKSAVLKVQNLEETRTSAFTVEPDQTPLYRRFNNIAVGEKDNDAADSVIFKEKIRGEYLMDEWNKNLQDKTVDYAGIWNKGKADVKLVFHIDTTWVNRGLGYIKPQYLISVARQDQDLSIVTHPCTEGTPHIKADGTPTEDPYECVHATRSHVGFAYGKYLVSFGDSAIVNDLDVPYMDVKGGYTRVGFVPAIKVGDSLIVLTNGFEKVEPAKIDTAKIFKFYKDNKLMNRIIDLRGDNHKNVTWSFRYVNPEKAMNAYISGEEGADNEFLFESNIYQEEGKSTLGTQWIDNADHDKGAYSVSGKATRGFGEVSGSIAPAHAAWLKMQNGCLVLTRGDSNFDAAKTGSDGALIFNAIRPTDADDMVTSNDEVSVEGVSVVAGNGTVTVQGAAGKSVVITNILGKVVAETVLTSDNATIAVPAGIVAVAVDGEEAVKTIVK